MNYLNVALVLDVKDEMLLRCGSRFRSLTEQSVCLSVNTPTMFGT